MYNLQLAFYNFSLFIFCIYFFRVQNYDISPTYEILICMDFLPFRRHFSVFFYQKLSFLSIILSNQRKKIPIFEYCGTIKK